MHRRPRHNYGFEQFKEILIFGAHIWIWRHASALAWRRFESRTLETPHKVGPPGGHNCTTANSKSKLPKYIG